VGKRADASDDGREERELHIELRRGMKMGVLLDLKTSRDKALLSQN
jgi:hypothetical protein